MFKVIIFKDYSNNFTFIFDNKEGNSIGFSLNIPIINKSFFLNKIIPEIIREKTGLTIDSKDIEFEFNKGEDDFNAFIEQNKNEYLKNKIRFIRYSYSLDKHTSTGISLAYNVYIVFEYENDKGNNYKYNIDSINIRRGKKIEDINYKTSLSSLISKVSRHGDLIIDENVISATENN